MYYQITTRCQLACDHCGFNCSPNTGCDMPLGMFKSVIESEKPEYITLGGGDPTMHPQFFDILMLAIRYSDSIFMATNGVDVEKTLECLEIFNKIQGASLRVSVDAYHPVPDVRIAQKIEQLNNSNLIIQGYEQRDVSRAGRAYANNEYTSDRCFCSELILQPDGQVKFCACPESPIIGTYKDILDDKLRIWSQGCIQNKNDIDEFLEDEEHKHLKTSLYIAHKVIIENIRNGE